MPAVPAPTKGVPEAIGLVPVHTGKRYVRVTSGDHRPDDLVAEQPNGACTCLRSACIIEQRAQRCGHALAAKAYLAAVDAGAVAPERLAA